jgi:hypothetical protein
MRAHQLRSEAHRCRAAASGNLLLQRYSEASVAASGIRAGHLHFGRECVLVRIRWGSAQEKATEIVTRIGAE